jgi:hypothetical protein
MSILLAGKETVQLHAGSKPEQQVSEIEHKKFNKA